MMSNQFFKKFGSILVLTVFILSFFSYYGENRTSASANLQVHYIDVGQGDAMLLKLPNGQNMVIDAGDNQYGQSVVNYIKNQGVSHIDYVVGTHPHADHIGGLDDVIKSFSIGKIYMPSQTSTSQTYLDVINAINAKKLTITRAAAGVSIINTTVSGKTFQMFMTGPVKNYSNTNDNSAVIKAVYGSTSFLFTGDAEHAAETDMINAGYDLRANILKVGHHGSDTSTSTAFLNKVNPSASVISVGSNSYGHPTSSTINRLLNMGSKIYRTDMNGTVIITTSGSGWLVNKSAWR
ncbi:MBL fold metallo-hydrolase [Bacillus lacus]|uniref:MBL fold metallo-hydrolase n=1 Tax=Metabacillus lacus TaxID=1983721 RepID=A0A7X2IXI6_9BACI|nr:MBL fold metallo-hydrolase [Metabacillus lacus]MRX71625.1 MBL fold metallo-hydrolase [Metabacillus lacus]